MIKKLIILSMLLCTITGCFQNAKPICAPWGCSRPTPAVKHEPPDGWPKELDQVERPSLGEIDCNESSGKAASKFLSNMFYYVFDPISTQVTIVSLIVFENFIIHESYKNIIRILLVLYVVIYGILFVANLIEATATDLLARIVKIGVILILTTGTAYDFFNAYLFKLFTSGSRELIKAVIDPNNCSSEIDFFAPVGYVIGILTDSDIMLRLTAMLFAFPIGWLCFPLFVLCILKYAFAILKIILAYLICFTAVAFLIALGPMFIILLLFDKTRPLFDHWLKLIIAFAFQPVLMFTGIYIVSAFINQILYNILDKCVWTKFLNIDLNIGPLHIPLLDVCWYLPTWWGQITDSRVYAAYLTYLGNLIMFYMCTDMLGKIPNFVETLATFLFSGAGGTAGGRGGAMDIVSDKVKSGKELLFGKNNEDVKQGEDPRGLIQKGAEKLKGVVGMDEESKARRAKAGEN